MRKSVIATGLCGLLALGSLAAIPGSQAYAEKKAAEQEETKGSSVLSESEEASETESVTDEADKEEGSKQVDKSESVYVQTKADGTPKEITVDTTLKNPGDDKEIVDTTNLSDIKNKEGDEEFTMDADGTLHFENHGEDIKYEGSSNATDSLPVEVKVSYYLDGKAIEGKDLAGKSGKVKIRFDYENKTEETLSVGDREVTVKVPFAMISAMFLDEDKFKNVDVKNGKLVDMDGQSIVVGYAFPGLSDSLELSSFEPTEDIDIPSYVEVTADVEDFELDFTATVATTGLFSDLDTEDLDDADDLTEAMDDLSDASKELVDGTSDLFDGVSEFNKSMKQYVSYVKKIDSAVGSFEKALKTMDDNTGDLTDGAKAIARTLKSLDSAIQSIDVSGDTDGKDEEYKKALAAATAIAADAQKLNSALTSLRTDLSKIESFVKDAKDYKDAVNEKVKKAENAIKDTKDAIDAIEASLDKDKVKVSASVESGADDKVAKAVKEALPEELSDEQKEKIVSAAKKAVNGLDAEASLDVEDGAVSLSGKDSAKDKAADALSALEDMPSLTIPDDLNISTKDIDSTLADMSTQMEILKKYASSVTGYGTKYKSIEDMLKDLKKNSKALSEGASGISTGVDALSAGIEKLYKGSKQMKTGTSSLAKAGNTITKGMSSLTSGVKALRDGMKTFDEEGIQELTDLAGDDLTNVIDRIKALKDADVSYDNFAGIKEGQTGEVRFIFETESIEKED